MTRGGLVLACALAFGCEAGARVGDSCLHDSDCPSPLACAIGRCREACRVSTDCPTQSRCLVDPATHVHVCSLEVDSCRTHPCPLGFVCRDDACVNACGSLVDCPDGVCVDGACARAPGPDAGSPLADAGPRDAGSDATSDASIPAVTTCPGATLIMPSRGETHLTYDPTGRTSSSGGCDPDLPDAYYVIRLAQRSIVTAWMDVSQAGALGWVTDCSGNTPPACESYCNQFVETGSVLDAGDHVLVLDDAGIATLHVVVFPLPDEVVVEQIAPPRPTFDLDTTLTPGTGLAGCGASGPTHVWWYYQCALGTAPQLDVSSCGSTANVDLALLDDGTGAVLACGANDAACTAGGLTASDTHLGGPAVVLIAASGHTPTDVGPVHVHGSLH